jgi:hypothetical protein
MRFVTFSLLAVSLRPVCSHGCLCGFATGQAPDPDSRQPRQSVPEEQGPAAFALPLFVTLCPKLLVRSICLLSSIPRLVFICIRFWTPSDSLTAFAALLHPTQPIEGFSTLLRPDS